ncbi:hypothetical protein JCM8097_006830 [Rhodosporidiobolus ruineniae]
MSFLSRLTKRTSSSSKDKLPTTSSKTPQSSSPLIPLDLPSSTLLAETTAAAPLLLRSPPPRSSFAAGDSPNPDESDLRSLHSEAEPWVEVAGDGSPRTTRTRQLYGEPEEKRKRTKAELEREKREWLRCEKARLGVAEVTLVLDECGAVIRSRGLTTLGLFRPYRLAESRPQQLKLLLLFLDYTAEFDIKARGLDSSIRGSEASKAVLLHAWREELRYAEVLDVVAVVKWALRHLSYPPGTSFGGTPTPSLSFYTSFLPRALSAPNAFSAYLLPSLPPSSQRLLLSTLALVQHVSAFSPRNAMPARRLCRLLGMYLFGLAPSSDDPKGDGTSFDDLYATWQSAGDALEGLLRASLREHSDLPPRLLDLVSDYEPFVARHLTLFGVGRSSLIPLSPCLPSSPSSPAAEHQQGGRQVAVLRLDLDSRATEWRRAGSGEVNDQITGRTRGRKVDERPPMRRAPGEVLSAAIGAGEAGGEEGGGGEAWRVVMRAARGEGGVEGVLDEETVRVLQLLELDRLPSSASSPAVQANGESTQPRSPTRRSSFGYPSSAPSPYGSTSGAKSVGNLFFSPSSTVSPGGANGGKRQVTPSWADFASTGFSASSTALSASNEFGLIDPALLPSRSATLSSRSRPSTTPGAATKGVQPSKLAGLAVQLVDEEFADVWLDSLAESRSPLAPVAGWPSIVLAPLRRGVSAQLAALDLAVPPGAAEGTTVDHLLVVERLLPALPPTSLSPPAASGGLNRALSSASSATASPAAADGSLSPRKKWRRRASAIFSSATGSASTASLSRRDGSGESASPTNTNPSSSSASPFSTLLPSARRSRKSFAPSEHAPPVPALPTLPPLPASPPPLPPKSLEPQQDKEDEPPRRPQPGTPKRSMSMRQLVKHASRVSLAAASGMTSPSPSSPAKAPRPDEPAAPSRPSPAGGGAEAGQRRSYISEVPLHPGMPALAPVQGSPALGGEEMGREKSVEGYEVDGGEEGVEEGNGGLGLVRAVPVFEVARAVEAETQLVEEREKGVEGLKPIPSPFDIESPMDPATPLPPSQQHSSFPLPDVSSSAASSDPVGAEKLDEAAHAAEPDGVVEPVSQNTAPPADEAENAPPIPALPSSAAEPPPTSAEELIATSSAPRVGPDEVEHHHPEQQADEPVFAVENPDVQHVATEEATEVAHVEDVAAPPTAEEEEKTTEERREEYDLDLPGDEVEEREKASGEAPTFTLSPPPPERGNDAQEDGQEKRFSEETVIPQEEKALPDEPAEDTPVGLGLAGAPKPPAQSSVEVPPATPKKSLSAVSASPTAPQTPVSPTLSPHSPVSRTLSQSSEADAGLAPSSPTPSNASSGSRKFLSNVGSLFRKKSQLSPSEKEAAKREKEEAKQLRKLREEELRREVRERKAPTPVSSVKKRVKEIEEEEKEATGAIGSGGGSGTSSPAPGGAATPVRTRIMSMYGSPAPASPTPASRSASGLARPASMISLPRSVAPTSTPPSSVEPAPVAEPVQSVEAQVDEPLVEPTGESDSVAADKPAAAVSSHPSSTSAVDQADAGQAVDTSVFDVDEPATEQDGAAPVLVETPALVEPVLVEEDDSTGPAILPAAADAPAQESEHLHVKLPNTLDALPSPIPSPTPQPETSFDPTPLAAGDDDLTQPLPNIQPPVFVVEPAESQQEEQKEVDSTVENGETRIEDDHTGPIALLDTASPAPAQESEHLHVKIPTSLDGLPSPIPSPTPLAAEGVEVEPLAEDLTETLPEIKPPVFVPVETAGEGEEPVKEVEEVAPAASDGEFAATVQHERDSNVVEEPKQAETASTPVEEQKDPLDSLAVSSPAPSPHFELPTTPTKPAPSNGTTSSSHDVAEHSTPLAPSTDVFSGPPAVARPVEETPTKPTPVPQLHAIRASPSQYSIATTTSFQTAESAQSSAASEDERWEAPDETF